MKGVIYARYSLDNQREESIEGQNRENTAYANKNGIDIVGTYIDRAYSADLAEKVSRGMTENALKCRFNGDLPTSDEIEYMEHSLDIPSLASP